MQNYIHVKFDERRFFKDLFLSDIFKKKNGTLNLSEISRQTGRDINTVKREINRFKNIEDYDAGKAHNDYLKKRKKCIKKLPEFTEEEKEWLNVRFNKYHDTPSQLIRKFKKKFGVKFPSCKKTLYKWIYLNLLELNKQNLRHHGKKYKRKGKTENRGKLDDKFKLIWDIKDKDTNVGFFEMDTVVGKDHQSSVLVLVEQNSKNYFAIKLEKNNSSEVLEKLEHIVRINGLVGKIKGIITDRGKEFSKFEEMEKITGYNIYFCDPGKPKQKPLIEYMNSELREWYPKRTDFNNVTQQELDWVVNDVINEKLRPVLNWRTANEVFSENFR